MKKNNYKKIIWAAALLVATGITAGIVLYYNKQQAIFADSAIRDLDQARDSQFILQAFKDDWYWLVAEGSTFSPELMLETRAYPQNSPYFNPLFIKVGYQDNRPAGFVAYYRPSLLTGKILFLYVIPEFRSQRWGRRLLDYAIKDLTNQGVVKVELVTRTNNEASQRLYNRYGFTELRRYDGFVEFVYLPKK